MQLAPLDWFVVAAYGVVALSVGLLFVRKAGEGTESFFLAGRKLPWWLLGTSMVATTFSTDTPNLVTDLVRTGGVSQNWVWWAFLVTGMLTVFFFARLWRRSGVMTDLGFYELRYTGRPAAFLRGFRAIYLGVFFNVMIMAAVTLAAIKIGGVLLGVGKYEVVLVAGTVTVLYSATSGLWGVVVTDLLLFVVSMVGSVAAAWAALAHPEVGGLDGLLAHPGLQGRLSILPDFSDGRAAMAAFVIPLSVQWWSTWYPGAEPGGGGYVAQRMLAARDEKDALKATLWFNMAHYALRPWPWILVALASVVVYPTLGDIQAAFPGVDASILGNDLGYPAMLVFLPTGLLGLVVASLAAAYMSTISTHLNWGASYVVDDAYRRFLAPSRSERHYVWVGRLTTVVLIVLSSALALWLTNAYQAFQILLQIGAGTGLVFILRWYWWRVNAWSEISAMVISFAVALWFQFGQEAVGLVRFDPMVELVTGTVLTTIGWLLVTLLTPPADEETLTRFVSEIRPPGPGWAPVRAAEGIPSESSDPLAPAFGAWFLGCSVVYLALFGTGYVLYGELGWGLLCLTGAAAAGWGLMKLLPMVSLVE